MATAGTQAARRAEFVTGRALELAHAARASVQPWSTTMALSRHFGWFDDADALVVVGCPGESQAALDLALAYGIGHVGDRELVLMLPQGQSGPTRWRLPWIDIPVRVFEFDDTDTASQLPPLTKHEVLDAISDPLVTNVHALGDHDSMVEDVISWADGHGQLVSAHRPSYLAWHCRGRMIIKLRRARQVVVVTVGVHSAAVGQGPLELVLDHPASPEQIALVAKAAEEAIQDRVSGADIANAEHQLQERLAEVRSQFRWVATSREFPAMRPVGRRAYIDLLAVDDRGAIHVVETKIGADEMLVLQGLDYWTWATAHRHELAGYLAVACGLDVSTTAPVQLDYVVSTGKGRTLSPYSAAQFEALHGEIPWRVHTFEDWATDAPTIESLPRRQVPQVDRAATARFAVRLEDDLIERGGNDLQRRVFLKDPRTALHPAARGAYDDLSERGLLHKFAGHVRSSQVFALNLFAGLGAQDQQQVWQVLDETVVEPLSLEFEYLHPTDALAESVSSSAHQTQADVCLRGRTADGQVCVALIEVKLSETAFGSCSAFDDPGNDRLDVCRTPGPWGDDCSGCFQLRNLDRGPRRRYDQFLKPAWVSADALADGCLFRVLNQPMRNVALARALLDRGDADRAIFALSAPLGNANVWRQWRQAQSVFGAVPGVNLRDLTAETLLGVLEPDRRAWVENRYGLVSTEA